MARKSVKDTEKDTLKGETKSAKGTSKKAFKEQDDEKALNLKSLTKSSVWRNRSDHHRRYGRASP